MKSTYVFGLRSERGGISLHNAFSQPTSPPSFPKQHAPHRQASSPPFWGHAPCLSPLQTKANTGRHYYSSQYFSQELHQTLISVSYRKSCDLLQNTQAWCHKGYWGLVIWNNHKALSLARPPRRRATANCSSFAKCWMHTTCQLVCLFGMRTLTLIRKKTQWDCYTFP